MDHQASSCTEQLWSMAQPVDAPWMCNQMREDVVASERYAREVENKNIELNRELGVFLLQMHIAREDVERARAERAELEQRLEAEMRESRELLSEVQAKTRELQDLRVELALLRSERELQEQQDQLAVEIWGPSNRRQPDATWDPPPVLLFSRSKEGWDTPLSIGRVAADLGYKCGAQQVLHLGVHVREAFLRAHGRLPTPRIFYDKHGSPHRVGCFTEQDRELLAAIVRRHGEPDVD